MNDNDELTTVGAQVLGIGIRYSKIKQLELDYGHDEGQEYPTDVLQHIFICNPCKH
jgi:hypothetical protein